MIFHTCKKFPVENLKIVKQISTIIYMVRMKNSENSEKSQFFLKDHSKTLEVTLFT